jgi:hypothetical protein
LKLRTTNVSNSLIDWLMTSRPTSPPLKVGGGTPSTPAFMLSYWQTVGRTRHRCSRKSTGEVGHRYNLGHLGEAYFGVAINLEYRRRQAGSVLDNWQAGYPILQKTTDETDWRQF